MKLVLKILRAIVVTLLLLITVVPALLYVILSEMGGRADGEGAYFSAGLSC